MFSPSAGPGQAAAPPSPEPSAPLAVAAEGPAVPASAARAVPAREPLLPEQSREDTDAAWGDYPAPSDDRLYRDRPPHWDDF